MGTVSIKERDPKEVCDEPYRPPAVSGCAVTINIGAVAITFIGLVVGLLGLGLAWRMVRGLPTDEHPKAADPAADVDADSGQASEGDD